MFIGTSERRQSKLADLSDQIMTRVKGCPDYNIAQLYLIALVNLSLYLGLGTVLYHYLIDRI